MKSRIDNVVFVLYFGLMALVVFGLAIYWHDFNKTPVQPINFSHKIHAGTLKLQCTVCHTTVEKSISASVPSVSKCMECHIGVATDKPEIIKLTQYWDNKELIQWEKVYSVPEHVYFSHKRHIKAGIDCLSCHGEIATMSRVRKVNSLTMGFCIDCHTVKGASRDCLTCHK